MPPPAEKLPRQRLLTPASLALGAFVLGAAGWAGSPWGRHAPENAGWPMAVLTLLALVTTLVSSARALPVQNVLAAAALIAFIASVAECINAAAGMPFGLRTFAGDVGPTCFGVFPWAVPVIWVVAVLNSRGVARLILRPWRRTSHYGYWVIGVTALLAVLFDLSLEPFAGAAQRFWVWGRPGNMPVWHGAPFYNFIGWLVVALLILAFVTPWLINKNPVRKSPPDYHPLVVWLVMNLIPAAGCAAAQLWSAAGFSVAAAIVVATFALRGARW